MQLRSVLTVTSISCSCNHNRQVLLTDSLGALQKQRLTCRQSVIPLSWSHIAEALSSQFVTGGLSGLREPAQFGPGLLFFPQYLELTDAGVVNTLPGGKDAGVS